MGSKKSVTRMHSSRMRTGQTLTVFQLETPKKLENPPKNWRPPEKIGDPLKNWRPPKKIGDTPTPEKLENPPQKIGDPQD